MRIEFVPQDLWIGLYWKTKRRVRMIGPHGDLVITERTYYLCIVPCFPIIWTRETASKG